MLKIHKNNFFLLGLAVVIYGLAQQGEMNFNDPPVQLEKDNLALSQSAALDASVYNAYVNGQTDVQIHGSGVVVKVLPDDREGDQHQKFILQTSINHTVLVAHNFGVAKRLTGLKKGDTVDFYGEYEWTQQGGVIHWTHQDREGQHANGWLKYNGETYQ